MFFFMMLFFMFFFMMFFNVLFYDVFFFMFFFYDVFFFFNVLFYDVVYLCSQSEELRRTLADKKPDSGAVIHSLKQKILKLETQMRDKESNYM